MKRYIDDRVQRDLVKKMVFLVGPRQVGKTTLSQSLLAEHAAGAQPAQYLNYDVLADRRVMLAQTWPQRTPLLVLDEIHKMPQWKSWLKGVYDGRAPGQHILVTGSARLDAFRHSGDSLAGRFFALRLHPVSVPEWCAHSGCTPDEALTHLLARGGFPEPCLASPGAAGDADAARWRNQYFDGLVRNDVLEFSRLQEVAAIRLFAELLRSRVGSPLSLASIARDLQISPTTLKKYLDILEALYIVFTVRPWHRNIARAILQSPKVYFYDTGLVNGDPGLRFENLVACALLKHVQWQQDTLGRTVDLHYIRTKDGAEVDFCLSADDTLSDLIECKLSDPHPHTALTRFATEWPQACATQLVRDLRQAQDVNGIEIRAAGPWLAGLLA
jgi:uncharacterized protein